MNSYIILLDIIYCPQLTTYNLQLTTYIELSRSIFCGSLFKPNPTYIRPWDHQFVQDVIIARMKTPEELKGGDRADFYHIIGFMKGEEVVKSREENPCQLEPYK